MTARQCADCGEDITDRGVAARRCVPCADEHRRERQRGYAHRRREQQRRERGEPPRSDLEDLLAEQLADTILDATMKYQHPADLTTSDYRAAAGLATRAISRDPAKTSHPTRLATRLRRRWIRPPPITTPTTEDLERIEATRERMIRAQEREEEARVQLRRHTTLDNARRWATAREAAAEAHADYQALTDAHYPDRRPPSPSPYTF